ncbi:MarR family winged helix-turn-helix transcriptional regulator [Streptosporangium lutulentum]
MGLLAEVYTGIVAKTHHSFTADGLSEIDFETLIRLARSPEHRLRMSDLAAQTSLSTSGATRVVDRLEREGLVTRQACDSDRRASYAVITEAGIDRLQAVIPQHLADIETWFTGLLSPNSSTPSWKPSGSSATPYGPAPRRESNPRRPRTRRAIPRRETHTRPARAGRAHTVRMTESPPSAAIARSVLFANLPTEVFGTSSTNAH